MRTPLLLALLLPACVDATDTPPPSAVELGDRLGVEIAEVTDAGIAVELVNGRDADADVALSVNVASTDGIAHGPVAEVLRLAPLERVAVTLPRADVPAFSGAAQLSVTAEVSYGDGTRRTPTSTAVAIVADASGWHPGDADAAIVSARPARDTSDDDDGDVPPTAPTADLVITQRLCFNMQTEYDDAGHGEDYWKQDFATFRTLRGADVQVMYDGTSLTGKLGDGLDGSHAGCIDVSGRGISNNDWLTVKVWSSGRVNGHDVRVETEATGGRASAAITVAYKREQQQTDVWYDITPGTSSAIRFNLYMAASYALFRHGGVADVPLTVEAHATGTTRGGSKHIWIADGEAHEKFSIAHEVGHYVAKNANANFGNFPSTCEDHREGVGKPCDASVHEFDSKEVVMCAAVEGFADFYAADVFNDHDGDDCFVTINGSPVVNCQGPNEGFPLRMMEVTCDGNDYAGYGVETDWMRVFWDVHTGGGADQPSFNDLLRWMEDADDDKAWTKTNVYDLLDAEAARRGGRIRTNWNNVKDDHGIDHPID